MSFTVFYRFWGLGHRHIWEAALQPTIANQIQLDPNIPYALPNHRFPSWIHTTNVKFLKHLFSQLLSFMEFYVGFSHQQHHYHHSEKPFGLITELRGLKGPQISPSQAPVEYLFLLFFRPEDRHWSPWIYFSVSHSICLPYLPLIPWQLTLPRFLFLQQRVCLRNFQFDIFKIPIREKDINFPLWLD